MSHETECTTARLPMALAPFITKPAFTLRCVCGCLLNSTDFLEVSATTCYKIEKRMDLFICLFLFLRLIMKTYFFISSSKPELLPCLRIGFFSINIFWTVLLARMSKCARFLPPWYLSLPVSQWFLKVKFFYSLNVSWLLQCYLFEWDAIMSAEFYLSFYLNY